MARYGWMVNLDACAHLNDPGDPSVEHFALNLGRPWTDDAGGSARGPEIADAKASLGDLLYPWKWSTPVWKVLGTADGHTWFPIDADQPVTGIENVDPVDAAAVSGPMTTELDDMTQLCSFPFSTDAQDYWGRAKRDDKVTARSHVHALAPLTHWPSHASGSVLSLSFILTVKAEKLNGATHIVCVPEFKFMRGNPPTEDVSGGVGTIVTQLASPAPGKLLAYVNHATPDIGFACLSAPTGAGASQPPKLQLRRSQGLLTRSALRSIVTGRMLPLALIRSWMDTLLDRLSAALLLPPKDWPAGTGEALALLREATFRDSLKDALWRSVGLGTELNLRSGTRPNVAEWLVPDAKAAAAPRLRDAMNTTTVSPQEAALAIRAVLDGKDGWIGLLHIDVSTAWTESSAARWKTFDELHRAGFDTGSDAAVVRYWQNWSALASTLAAEDGAVEFLSPWLSFVHDAKASADPEAKAVWIDEVRPALRARRLRHDHVARARSSLVTLAQWAAIKDSAGEPGVVVDPTTLAAASVQAVGDLVGPVCAQLIHDAPLGALSLDSRVAADVSALQAALADAGTRSRPRSRDRGMRLDFSAAESGKDADALKAWDNQVRGYAIALCGGVIGAPGHWAPDGDRACWITDTALMLAGSPVKWIKLAGGDLAWMHDTVGATTLDGERVLSVEFDGIPAATALADKVAGTQYAKAEGIVDDGFKALDFGWPAQERPLPAMAYGAGYHAIATAIDNAGGVVDKGLRGSKPGVLVDAKGVFAPDAADPFQYLSSEPPGRPRVLLGAAPSLYELSEETQAHAHQTRVRKGVPAAKVALLGFRDAPDFLAPSVSSKCDLQWTAPKAHREFAARWLEMDRLILHLHTDKDALFDPTFKNAHVDEGKLVAFANKVLQDKAAYNPAVSALGIEVLDVIGRTAAVRTVKLERSRIVGAMLEHWETHVQCTVQSAPETAAFEVSPVTGTALTVTIPQGKFACIRVYALVSEGHFDAGKGSFCRFAEGIYRTVDVPVFTGYRAFDPLEYWFEVMPAWKKPATEVTLTLLPPGSAAGREPAAAVLQADFGDAPWVSWTRGLVLQRHEWHWTGYPVELPRAEELPAWLASFSGVESFRESIDATLSTSFDASGKWFIGKDANNLDTVHRWTLPPGARPARYGAYFARPVLRFQRWLKTDAMQGPRELERQVYATGAIIKGRRPTSAEQRIPAPALRWSVPLTACYAWSEGATLPGGAPALERRPNGSLLVFDDAMRRTDDLAVIGGLGDTLEIDLLETRVQGLEEIGTNPIFHANPTTRPAFGIEPGVPFGLTFDIGSNPKVAQTALVVTPTRSAGRWTMAKLRARRLILPETELASDLAAVASGSDAERDLKAAVVKLSQAEQDALGRLGGPIFEIATRVQGDDSVPLDLSIDLYGIDAAVAPVLSLVISHGEGVQKLDLNVPSYVRAGVALPGAADRRRLLVSWHKGRWKGGEDPSWRAQVLLQAPRPASLAWQPGSDAPKVSCYQNAGSQLPLRLGSGRVWLFTSAVAARSTSVSPVRMSDYTDPIWMSFIGNFGTESLGLGNDYRMKHDVGRNTLALVGRRPDTPLPSLKALDLNEPEPLFHLALLFRPIADVAAAAPEAGSGSLVATFMATGTNQAFGHLPLVGAGGAPPDLAGCHAYVLSMQRATGLSASDRAKLSKTSRAGDDGWQCFQDLLKLAFPDPFEGRSVESLLRFLPEYLGPVAVET